MKASKGNTNTSTLSSSDQKFMMEAATAGMEEVELGRLAATHASSDAVKQFGQRMVDDHSKANDELMQIASTKGVTLPTALDDKHKADVTKMSQLSGAAFDSAYVKEAGVKDHNKAAKLFQGEADKGKDADLKAFAAKTLPTVQDHLRMAQELDNGMRATKSAAGGNTNTSGNMNTSGNTNMSGNSNMSGDRHESKDKNKNKNSNMSNSNMSNSNMSNSNVSNSNMSDNSNMSNSNTSNSNMSNSNTSNSNTSNSNMSDNSNTSNSNGNSNQPR
jgi:putative membrane protein